MALCSTTLTARQRHCRNAEPSSRSTSTPSSRIEPPVMKAGGLCSRAMAKATVLLPEAGFAGQPEHLVAAEREGHIFDRAAQPLGRGVIDGERLDAQQRLARRADRVVLGLRAFPGQIHAEGPIGQGWRGCDAARGGVRSRGLAISSRPKLISDSALPNTTRARLGAATSHHAPTISAEVVRA